MSYADRFRVKRIHSSELRSAAARAWWNSNGFCWVRRVDSRSYDQILRNPTVGCLLELCILRQVGCVPLDSPAARKMIQKICYF